MQSADADPPAAFAAACRRRNPIRAAGTNAVRLLDGAGDGRLFDGLIIDDFAGRWLVQTTAPDAIPPDWLRTFVPAPRSIYWKRLDARTREAPAPWAGEEVDALFEIQENSLRYWIDFQAGYSQGIFLDQRDNRLSVRQRSAPGGSVLNCFAYSCGFSVAAAAARAQTVSIDLSRRALDRGRNNFRLNGIDPSAGHEFLVGDVFDWLRRLGKQHRRFNGIVLDPPTFSRNRDGNVFRVEADYGRLVELAVPLLAPDAWLLCTANQRSLSSSAFRRAVATALPSPKAWQVVAAPMPPDFPGQPYLLTVWVVRL